MKKRTRVYYENQSTGFNDIDTKYSQMHTKKNKNKLFLSLAVFVFVAALLAIVSILYSYHYQAKQYKQTSAEYFHVQEDSFDFAHAHENIDWDGLRAVNSEVVGWIKINNTAVDYPIVQAQDNEKYIKTNFQGETNWLVSPGALFLDTNAVRDFSSQNSVIYGHNMNDGSMFSCISEYTSQEYFESHKTIVLYTPKKTMLLEPFAINHVSSTAVDKAQYKFASEDEFIAFINKAIEDNLVSTSFNNENIGTKRIVSLCTCDNSNSDGRYILYCFVTELS